MPIWQHNVGRAVDATIGAINEPNLAKHGLTLAASGALIRASSEAVSGCTAGATLGSLVDSEILDNFECLPCGHICNKQLPN